MRKICGVAVLGILALLTAGCGKSTENGLSSHRAGEHGTDGKGKTSASAEKVDSGPAAAVGEFLEAVRTGNDDKAAEMLSTTAREKTAALNRNVTPPASDTARFAVGEVEYVGEDGARVASTWTDLDINGQSRTDKAVWVLRREEKGWRIAGVAVVVFPGEPMLLLNFEDPEDMFRKQQWVRGEIQRRMNEQASERQAQEDKKTENPIRR